MAFYSCSSTNVRSVSLSIPCIMLY